MTAKEQIIDLFRKNVKGKSPNVENQIPKKETAILGPDLLVQKLEHIIIAVKF